MTAKIIFSLSILALTFQLYAQTGTVTGVVLEGNGQKPIPFANIYINNTTLGVQSDDNGHFVLSNIPFGEHEIVASFVGHLPYQSRLVVSDTLPSYLTIKLQAIALKAVEIKGTRDVQWNKDYEKFQRLFIGDKKDLQRCKILNPWVLEFAEPKQDVFSATAGDIIKIENLRLGYRVYFELKNFLFSKSTYLISGNIRFVEMATSDDAIKNEWIKNRADAYRGSSRHLLKAIVDKRVEEEGFVIFNDLSNFNQVVRELDFHANLNRNIFFYDYKDKISPGRYRESYRLELPLRMEIHYVKRTMPGKVYRNIPHPVSWMDVKDRTLEVKNNGVVIDPKKLMVSGEMGLSRVAGMLPLDYMPIADERTAVSFEAYRPVKSLTFLLEKPYLHTDKSYYYPNETIWLKAYMNYYSRAVKDSLSHVLFVELIDANQKLVNRKIFPITNGLAIGDLLLDPEIAPGDYALRSYTRWMLNFDSSLIFVKPIKILTYNQVAVPSNYVFNETKNERNVILNTDKESYTPREKITVSVEVRDQFEIRVATNFSVSVTDIDQAAAVSAEKNILDDFPLKDISVPDSIAKSSLKNIQYGMEISGSFQSVKGKEVEGIVTFYEKGTSNMFAVLTNPVGRFYLNTLQLTDSAQIGVQAKTIKGKPGKVTIDSLTLIPEIKSFKKLPLQIQATEVRRHPSVSSKVKTIQLKAVTVTDSRIDGETSSRTHLISDYSITADWIKSSLKQDLISVLQARIPGFRASGNFLQLGPPISPNTDPSTSEPLVVVDGIIVNTPDGNALVVLSSMSPRDVERIEVLKYGSAAAYGARGANGAIVIYTKKGGREESGANYDFNKLQRIKIAGYSATRKFSVPDYSTESDAQIPDTRTTIYWNPDLKGDNTKTTEVSFYASDSGRYRIVVEGITSDGIPFRAEKMINVVHK
jgi:TonB-dependent SusC/RagA subfamily outer membrane receptor